MIRLLVRFLAVCCLFIAAGQQSVLAQQFEEKAYLADIMSYNQFPLDSLWQYQAGDSLALPKNGSASWRMVNAELLRDLAGKPLAWPGTGWFRKQWQVPPRFRGKAMALRMGHFGASEIYLDGRLIQRYGHIGKTLAEEKTVHPRQPFSVQLDGQETHWLVVHYANYRANLPAYTNKVKGFRLVVSAPVYRDRQMAEFLPMMFSIMVAFTVLFGFIYIFYPTRLASLFSALTLADLSSLFFFLYLLNRLQNGDSLILAAHVRDSAVGTLELFALLNVYVLFYGRLPWRAWLLAGWGLAVIVLVWTMSPAAIIIPPIALLISLERLRILILGVRRQKDGFLILLVGYVLAQLFFFIIAIDVFNWFPVFTYSYGILLLINGMITPLTLALHLAWEFSTANKVLKMKLVQVEQLSHETLRQEQEKQHLLATQNETLELQVTERTTELSQSLAELRTTQTQLIQKEKLASLGELTAGIAHEIQNPLNFVNNFSEVSTELIEELKEEAQAGHTDEVLAIADDLTQNLQKITHHGGRASAIVRGMLEHSRSSSGEKQLTDLNALADEYLKIAYHGLRARDTRFNAELTTDFAAGLGRVDLIPQEIGRVLLNLYNNAFYAIRERSLQEVGDYKPTLSLSTKRTNNTILIRIHDNGTGIPDAVKAKIFQPFFTTKPTGEGTGLGLSLSYDIVTKGHGGTLTVESAEGEGTAFVVQLPC